MTQSKEHARANPSASLPAPPRQTEAKPHARHGPIAPERPEPTPGAEATLRAGREIRRLKSGERRAMLKRAPLLANGGDDAL